MSNNIHSLGGKARASDDINRLETLLSILSQKAVARREFIDASGVRSEIILKWTWDDGYEGLGPCHYSYFVSNTIFIHLTDDQLNYLQLNYLYGASDETDAAHRDYIHRHHETILPKILPARKTSDPLPGPGLPNVMVGM